MTTGHFLLAALAGVCSPEPAQQVPVASVPQDRAQSTAEPANRPAYRIEAGDQLSVSFPYNPELNMVGPVGPDGRFAVPVVGNLELADRTLDEAATLISLALRRSGVVEDSRPTVSIQQYGAVVYVGGEVRLPGPVKLPGRLDPLQAVISAGGLLDTARSHRVVILHRTPDGRIVQTDVDLRAYARRGVPTNVALQSQDIVFVPRSSIAEADLWIDQHINKLLPFSRSLNYSLGPNPASTVLSR